MDARGTNTITRLTKRDVEHLLADYDRDPVAALTTALRRVLDVADANWPTLVQAAGFSDTRTAALLVTEQRALDALAAELNELRTVIRRPIQA